MPKQNDTTATKKLEQIKADILEQNICPDLAQTSTQLVMGHGNANARVVFIGEAPGKNEDLQGIPFVGAAGKLLDEMLSQARLERSDVYITNIVKYRPPNNRDPLPEEKQAFLPFLMRELSAIQPLIIATLGRHSMEFFLPGKRISEIHGEPKRIQLGGQKVVILPLFHPAAALYNGGLRQTLFDDFANLPEIINQLEQLNKE